MVGDEREKHPRTEEPDVEAHAHHSKLQDDAPADKSDEGGDDDDTPDVEAHRHKL
jgi:hypothetical protein